MCVCMSFCFLFFFSYSSFLLFLFLLFFLFYAFFERISFVWFFYCGCNATIWGVLDWKTQQLEKYKIHQLQAIAQKNSTESTVLKKLELITTRLPPSVAKRSRCATRCKWKDTSDEESTALSDRRRSFSAATSTELAP